MVVEKNPNGQLPTLELNGEVIWESGAIMQILLEKFDTENMLEPAKGSPLRGGAVCRRHTRALPGLASQIAQTLALCRRVLEVDVVC